MRITFLLYRKKLKSTSPFRVKNFRLLLSQALNLPFTYTRSVSSITNKKRELSLEEHVKPAATYNTNRWETAERLCMHGKSADRVITGELEWWASYTG